MYLHPLYSHTKIVNSAFCDCDGAFSRLYSQTRRLHQIQQTLLFTFGKCGCLFLHRTNSWLLPSQSDYGRNGLIFSPHVGAPERILFVSGKSLHEFPMYVIIPFKKVVELHELKIAARTKQNHRKHPKFYTDKNSQFMESSSFRQRWTIKLFSGPLSRAVNSGFLKAKTNATGKLFHFSRSASSQICAIQFIIFVRSDFCS